MIRRTWTFSLSVGVVVCGVAHDTYKYPIYCLLVYMCKSIRLPIDLSRLPFAASTTKKEPPLHTKWADCVLGNNCGCVWPLLFADVVSFGFMSTGARARPIRKYIQFPYGKRICEECVRLLLCAEKRASQLVLNIRCCLWPESSIMHLDDSIECDGIQLKLFERYFSASSTLFSICTSNCLFV